jgi:predicted Zn-dependent protease
VFEPSAWEWAFRAGPYLRSDPGEARRILEEGLEHHPTSPSIHYTLACVDALAGNTREALDALRVAVEREPELKAHARKDSDLDSIREDPAFEELTK